MFVKDEPMIIERYKINVLRLKIDFFRAFYNVPQLLRIVQNVFHTNSPLQMISSRVNVNIYYQLYDPIAIVDQGQLLINQI